MSEYKCPVCGLDCTRIIQPSSLSLNQITCKKCGIFLIDDLISAELDNALSTPRKRAIASSIVHSFDTMHTISDADFEHITNANDISVTEKADNLLKIIGKRCLYVGEDIEINANDYELFSRSWILDQEELRGFIGYLLDRKFIKNSGKGWKISITPDGWQRIEELSKPDSNSSQCFVAMWFDDTMQDIYNNYIKKSIEESGYTSRRIDEKEHIGKIEDEMIKEIRRSKFIVADMTGQRGGVYYEAGFAHGHGLEVIWTARKDTKLHFDINHYNCIFWEDDKLDDFRSKLSARIEAIFGHGPINQ
jgi:hypothetical protein